jgi:hypothetical protein
VEMRPILFLDKIAKHYQVNPTYYKLTSVGHFHALLEAALMVYRNIWHISLFKFYEDSNI